MPQIEQVAATYASQIFWLLLTFGIVFLVIGRGMAPKVQSTVDARDAQVAADLVAATDARAAADAQEEAWRARENANREAARSRIAAARDVAAQASATRLAAGDADNATRIAEAEARIAEATRGVLDEIEGVAAGAAQDIVARLTGAEIADADARAAVGRVIGHG